ncbi:MAG: response regulator [Candidatus Hydrogenedentota bacterium]|nr:MAG: response regulator [Candidatus Hydrogenedentota bacterium]
MSQKALAVVIEDSAISRAYITSVLKELNISFTPFESLPSLNQVKQSTFLVTDFMLQEGSVEDFLLNLRASGYQNPILLVTSMPEEVLQKSNVLEAVNFLLRKPFSKEELKKALELVLQEKKFTSEKKLWCARKNPISNKPELFESPFLQEINGEHVTFESLFHYDKGDNIILWMTSPDGMSLVQKEGVIEKKEAKTVDQSVYTVRII